MENKNTPEITAEKKKARKHRRVQDILVYEIMDGKPIYYHDTYCLKAGCGCTARQRLVDDRME